MTVIAPSSLDAVTLARMRADAERGHSSRHMDPALVREAERFLPGMSTEWLTYVVGRPVMTYRYFTTAELILAVAAAKADAEYLREAQAARYAAWEQERKANAARAASAHQREADAWDALRAALPVPVSVWHNWTARHYDGWIQGADHAVVLEDLHAGRLHRQAKDPLCWTPSRAHQLRHVTPNGTDDERRIPDCKACLRTARQLAKAEEEAGKDRAVRLRITAREEAGEEQQ